MTGWMDMLSVILNLVLGGSFIISLLTLRSTKQKAQAEADVAKASVDVAKASAKTSELDNVQEAVKIWREMAESLKQELAEQRTNYNELIGQIEALRKEVSRLTTVNNKIVKLLDKITPENLEKMIEQIKNEIHESNG